MTPAETAALALTEAKRWIRQSPRLLDVLDWHRELCGTCETLRPCDEYSEILAEYGAGTHGIAAFYPSL